MIIKSFLDLDYYKISMMQAVFHRFPAVDVEYEFRCRTPGIKFTRGESIAIQREIDALCTLRFTHGELLFLYKQGVFSHNFLSFLETFRLNPGRYVFCRRDTRDSSLEIKIKGPWLQTILFETLILSIVNEVYFRKHTSKKAFAEGRRRLSEKLRILRFHSEVKFADFGTRRRFSSVWQEQVLQQCIADAPNNLIGTSNVHYARTFGIKPVGTMAHEFLAVGQALVPLWDSQKYMLDQWLEEYRGELGIALSDIVGFAAFLSDFDYLRATAYDGCRHDSGDPYIWCDKLLAHYSNFGIDSRTKTAVFSDSLTFPTAIDIFEYYRGKIKMVFGIGTNLMNDCGPKPLNIVIKAVRANGRPVAKISDSSGKGMCNDTLYLRYLKQVFNIKEWRISK